MKSFPKILIILFLSVFILQIICLFFLLAAPVASQAISFTPQVGIPGAENGFQPGGSYTFQKNNSTAPIAQYIRAIYNYGVGIIGILAAVVLMVGGVMWIVAGGNATQIGEAKAWIGAALTGLVLALTSYLILSTVNPALVDLKTTAIQTVAELKTGCCTTTDTGKSVYENDIEQAACEKSKEDGGKGGKWTQEKCETGTCEVWISSAAKECKDNYTKTMCDAEPGFFMAGGSCSCCAYEESSTSAYSIIASCQEGTAQQMKILCDSRATLAYKWDGIILKVGNEGTKFNVNYQSYGKCQKKSGNSYDIPSMCQAR